MIRVAVLDDHPAVRSGLQAILAPEPDLIPVGFAANEEQVWSLLHHTRPDVIVLDVHHPGRDGLALSLDVKRRLHAPAVVLYPATTPKSFWLLCWPVDTAPDQVQLLAGEVVRHLR
jgi:chemotaxis response regulator CheB